MTESSNPMRDELLSDHGRVRAKFVEHFKAEVEQLAVQLDVAFARLGELDQKIENDRRAAWVQTYLHLALNNVLTAGQLLLVGLLQPVGNQMRVFGESVAMALLMSHPETGVFERFEEDPTKYPVQKAIDRVGSNENLEFLGIQQNLWKNFMEYSKWFNRYSHASALTAATQRNRSQPSGLILGSEFDVAKVGEYRKLINGCIGATKLLVNVIDHMILLTQTKK